MRFSAFEGVPTRRAPRLGEHTADVLGADATARKAV
jgi:crotonobetainyl-CoA:carnitine CoA-transferase CaiB-like acyl-CoA transferase